MAISLSKWIGTNVRILATVPLLLVLAACQTVEPIQSGEKVGLVLLHGKNSRPEASIQPLASSLSGAGVLVEAPLMPWGRGRIYDKGYEESMVEIDEAVQRLKDRGAKKIIVGGHSLGVNAAIGYGARRENLSGLILLAAGHTLRPQILPVIGSSLAKARRMVAEGDGGKMSTFRDFNQGRRPTRAMTANVYLSWFDPDGPASVRKNVANLKKGTPVLLVTGNRDRVAQPAKAFIFDNLPPHPLNKFELIPSTHRGTPGDAIQVVADWLRALE